VFLDRDDTIMHDAVYCRNPEDVCLLPGAAEGIRALEEAGFLIIIATNQSGLGRGSVTEEELAAVNQRLREEQGRRI
jgi:HAD superfamily hydrolase (TIGR01662 family)